jgi:acetyl esterase/lipase
MKKLISFLADLLALFSAVVGGLIYRKTEAPGGFAWMLPRLFAGGLAPFAAVAGAAGAVLGALIGAPLAVLAGIFGAVASLDHVRRVTEPHGGFEKAFGPDWPRRIPAELGARLPPQRWSWKPPVPAEPRRTNDLPFWTIPGTGQKLLCDVWQPPTGVTPSGLSFLYFHGSAWTLLDKDFGTRTFFSHLAGQGHVVMDVAYRLAPETGMDGMVDDVKRAISWMKVHAAEYGASPQRIVVGGGSAGGQLAMLAAYAPDHPELTPDELRGQDLAVRGVVSEYGPSDLSACYYHTRQDKIVTEDKPRPAAAPPAFLKKLMGDNFKRLRFDKAMNAGSLKTLLGGSPQEVPQLYDLYSPACHVHPGCPPTLLIQGEDDLITPVDATQELYQKLVAAGVPAVNIIYPHTEHGFDLALPAVSPTAQSAFYEIDRFLALLA